MGKNKGGNARDRAMQRAASDPGPHPAQSKPPIYTPAVSAVERIFLISENGWVLAAVSLIAGFAGVFVDGRWFVVLCIPIAFGVHRSKGLHGLRWISQIGLYSLIIGVSAAICWQIGLGVNRSREHIPTVKEMGDYLSKIWVQKGVPNVVPAQGDSPLPSNNANLSALREKTNNLARELVDFSDQRIGNLALLKVRLQAAVLADAIAGTSNQVVLRNRLNAWNSQSDEQFQSLYWSRVEEVLADLASAKVDTSPVSRAVATPYAGMRARAVGLQLSLLAERIGKNPPFPQHVTPLEWQVIVKDIGGSTIQIYANLNDRDSVANANGLLRELKHQNKNFKNKIYPLSSTEPSRAGIWIFLPSLASVGQSALAPTLKVSEIEGGVTYWQVMMSPRETPVTKFEVWPCDSSCRESFIFQNRGFN